MKPLHQLPFILRSLAVFALLAFGLQGAWASGFMAPVLQVDSPQTDLHYPIIDPPATSD